MIDHVFEKMERIVVFRFSVLGHEIEIGNTIVVTWIIMAVLIALALLMTRRLSVDKPGKPQLLLEALVGFVNGLCRDAIGARYRTFVPYVGTVLVYLVMANMMAVFNCIPGLELYPPTKDINVTGALALMTILLVLVSGWRYRGLRGWVKGLMHPMPIMLPFNLLEYLTKPLSLCLRLVGNIIAGFLIMELILSSAPLLATPFSAYFDLFDGVLQAYIFVYLTTMYLGEAVEEHE